MIDHLIEFESEAAAIQALPHLRKGDAWAPNVSPVQIVIDPGEVRVWEPEEFVEDGDWQTPPGETEAVFVPNGRMIAVIPEGEDLSGQVIRPRVVAPGFYLMVALPALDSGLRNLPDNACRLIAYREAAKAGEAFLLYTAPNLSMEVMAVAVVEPTFAGSRYPFGAI